jgi:cobalt-zinc-cadmium efflux system outer membrane protein
VLQPLIAKAMEQRPDLRAAQKGVALADAHLVAARREGYPDISVGAAFTHSEFTVSGDNGNSLGLSVALPLPVFDRNQGGIARSRLDRKRSDNDIARLDLIVQHEVAEAVRRVERSGTLLDVYEGGGMLSRADHALRVAETSYKAGAVSLLELLEAQRTFIETRMDYLKVQDDYRKAQVDVTHAVGEKTP